MPPAPAVARPQPKAYDFVNIAFLAITPLIAVLGTAAYVWRQGLVWQDAVLFFVMYYLTGLGITAGYHRYYAHRTYECRRPLQLLYLVFGAAAVENSVLNWASDHRDHHRYVDREEDPYNILRGGLYAHVGWIFYKDTRDQKRRFQNVPDLLKDPLVAWQDRWYLAIVALAGFGLPTLVGALYGRPLAGLLIGGFLRCVVVQHMTFLINSAAHLWGSRPYTEDNTARDSWWLGLFTFGEGYHNFHHKFQADYRNGIRWYQFDLGKWWLLAMRAIGQADRLRKAPEPLILKARLEVQMRHVEQKLAAAQAPERMWQKVQSRLEAGRRRLEGAYAQYQVAKAEYLRRKHEWSEDVRRQWREQVEAHQAEFDDARRRWNDLLRAMNRIPRPSAQTAFSMAFVVDLLKYKVW